MAWVAVAGAATGAILGGISNRSSSSPSGTQTQTQQQTLDPRIANLVFGSGGQTLKPGAVPVSTDENGVPTYSPSDYVAAAPGLVNRYAGLLDNKQNTGIAAYGNAADQYVGANGANNLADMNWSSHKLMNSDIAAPQIGATNVATPAAVGAANMTAATVANTPAMQAAQMGNVPGMQAAQAAAAPTMTGAQATAAQVNAPSQNSLDLSSAYRNMVSGDAAQNPYLTGAIQQGINQSNNAFGNMLTDQTKATQSLMNGIRGDAVSAGQYGGSRQGIAEGKAMDSFNTNMSRAAAQYGQNNTDAALAAQSQAFNQGQDRSLSAMNGLSGQQYGTAQQNASMGQQTNLANQASTNLGLTNNQQAALATNLANAGYQNTANQNNYQGALTTAANNANLQNTANNVNYQGGLTSNLANAGYAQDASKNNASLLQTADTKNADLNQNMWQYNANNLQSANLANANLQNTTNTLNSQNQLNGLSASSGLLGNATTAAQNQDGYALNQASKVNGLLTPYVGLNQTNTQTNPLYSNTAGNILGGAATGMGLVRGLNLGSGMTSFDNNSSNSAYNPNAAGFNAAAANYNPSNYG